MDFEEFAEAVAPLTVALTLTLTLPTPIGASRSVLGGAGVPNVRCRSKVFRTILIRNPQKKAATVDDMSARHSALTSPACVTHQRNGWHAKYSSSFVVV